jgi:membrane dipeptidase
MTRISHAAATVACASVVLTACSSTSAPDQPSDAALLERARAIHERVLTIDTHDDIPFDFGSENADPAVRGRRQVDLPKMREGGLDAAFFIVYVGQARRKPENYAKARDGAIQKFDGIARVTRTYPEQIGLACRADDVEAIAKGKRLVAVIGIENGFSMGTDLDRLAEYYDRCARYFGLVHNGHNDLADSAQPNAGVGDAAEEHGGLSPLGERVVGELNRLGMMVDVSHSSKKSMLHAVRVSRAPIIASHSGAHAVNPHPRNLDDEQLQALKANGGVVQAVALDGFVKTPDPEKATAVAALREEFGVTTNSSLAELPAERRAEYDRRLADIEAKWPRATVADFVNHIDHIVKTIGVDHVGIASDFDGGGGVTGWNDASETFNVTLELVRRGYSEPDIAKIWGGNLLRVWREVERISSELRAR